MRTATEKLVPVGSIWPPIDYEIEDLKPLGYLDGLVLNAGCGVRDICHLVPGKLINQDIHWPNDTRTSVDIFCPLHSLPVPDNYFDTILCIAVLEHVINPDDVVDEMARVLRPGGIIVASVPFMQPEHLVPTDFQRYTRDGLDVLFVRHGLKVEEIKTLFTVYHTLYWMADEVLQLKDCLRYKLARILILPVLAFLAKKSKTSSRKTASAFRIIARKPNAGF